MQEQDSGAHIGGEAASPQQTSTADEAAPTLASQASYKLLTALDTQRIAVADLVDAFAGRVHRVGEQFGDQQWIAGAIGRGGAELQSLAATLRDKDLEDLAGGVRSFAARRPALFMSAALVAGFAVARLGKAVAGNLTQEDLPTMPEVSHGGS